MVKRVMTMNKEIITIGLDTIVPYENNPRDNDDTVPYLMNSMEKHGYNSLIEVNENKVILVGHTRLKALKQLHLNNKLGKGKLKDTTANNVKVMMISGLSEAEQKAYRIANNKVGEPSGWLFDKLNIELKEIKDLDPLFNGEDFGFTTDDINEPDPIEVEDVSAPEDPLSITIDAEPDDIHTLKVWVDGLEEAQVLMDRLKLQGYKCKLD